MADNTVLPSGSGGDTIATDDITDGGVANGAKAQRIKVGVGTDNNYRDVSEAADGGLPVQGEVAVDAALGTNPVIVGGRASTATPTAVSADNDAQSIWLDRTGAVQVGDAGGSLTVDSSTLTTIAGAVSGAEMQVDVVGALPTGTATIGNVGLATRTSGGLTIHRVISAATTNATSVKASAGQLYTIAAFSINAAVRFLKLYNKATAPTVGTDTPVLTFMIPGDTAGTGFVLNISHGWAFSTGIAFALTTGIADSNTGAVAADEIVINLGYA